MAHIAGQAPHVPIVPIEELNEGSPSYDLFERRGAKARLIKRAARSSTAWALAKPPTVAAVHVRFWRAAGGSDNPEPERWRGAQLARRHGPPISLPRGAEGGLMTPSGYGEGAVIMGVEPPTSIETLPVPWSRFLRV